MPVIEVRNLAKTFRVTKRRKGLLGALGGLFRPERALVHAVNDISFDIEPGEIVGYVGPNGAGKSTTVKILCGILQPTSGEVRINGLSPRTDRKAIVQKLGVVFGQRSQLAWDIRLGESFELLRRIYRIDTEAYERSLKILSDLLQLDDLIDTPVRQLSLGQRMRGDLAASMLHSPPILFLDEPTIGLDLVSKRAIRQFILEVNALRRTTIILTTHDLEDVEQLCRRLVVINHGKVVEDGPLDGLIDRLAPYRVLLVDFEEEPVNLNIPEAEIMERKDRRVALRFDRKRWTAAHIIRAISDQYEVRDLTVKEPSIEEVIRTVYETPSQSESEEERQEEA